MVCNPLANDPLANDPIANDPIVYIIATLGKLNSDAYHINMLAMVSSPHA